MFAALDSADFAAEDARTFCRLFAACVRAAQTITFEKAFRRGSRVSESEFHDELERLLREDPELNGRLSRRDPVAGRFDDLLHDDVVAELKVSRGAPATVESPVRYLGQPTQYGVGRGSQLSVLVVFDHGRKRRRPEWSTTTSTGSSPACTVLRTRSIRRWWGANRQHQPAHPQRVVAAQDPRRPVGRRRGARHARGRLRNCQNEARSIAREQYPRVREPLGGTALLPLRDVTLSRAYPEGGIHLTGPAHVRPNHVGHTRWARARASPLEWIPRSTNIECPTGVR